MAPSFLRFGAEDLVELVQIDAIKIKQLADLIQIDPLCPSTTLGRNRQISHTRLGKPDVRATGSAHLEAKVEQNALNLRERHPHRPAQQLLDPFPTSAQLGAPIMISPALSHFNSPRFAPCEPER
jgi:hypothetical protein